MCVFCMGFNYYTREFQILGCCFFRLLPSPFLIPISTATNRALNSHTLVLAKSLSCILFQGDFHSCYQFTQGNVFVNTNMVYFPSAWLFWYQVSVEILKGKGMSHSSPLPHQDLIITCCFSHVCLALFSTPQPPAVPQTN